MWKQLHIPVHFYVLQQANRNPNLKQKPTLLVTFSDFIPTASHHNFQTLCCSPQTTFSK